MKLVFSKYSFIIYNNLYVISYYFLRITFLLIVSYDFYVVRNIKLHEILKNNSFKKDT